MAQHVWSVLCRLAIVSEAGTVSLIEVVSKASMPAPDVAKADRLLAEKGAPIGFPLEMVIVNRWRRTDPENEERAEGRIRIRKPDGRLFQDKTEFSIDLSGDTLTTQPRINFPVFPYVGLGRYVFLVDQRSNEKARWKTVARLDFEVAAIQE